ncbi:MAG: hypothetical protein RLY71_2140 [Pseudomonadota bacterium]|jgi:LacI family transcriptional regulator
MSTIKDVARLAGVGVATASRALSGNGPVSADTLVRVRAAAAELDYRPSAIARALSLQRSEAIGLFVPAFDSWFYAGIMTRIDAGLRAAGRHMVATGGSGPGDQRQQALDGIEFLLGRDCDGLIVASHHLRDADLQALCQRQPRLVVINRQVPRMASHCFVTDHLEGGRLAARALLSRGHRDIAVLSGPHDAPDNEQRMAGFLDELAQHELRPVLQFDGDFTYTSGAAIAGPLMAAIDRRLPAARRCSAIFCANDLMALGLSSCLTQAGWRLPDELSLLGYDDADIAPYATPPLTTIHAPIAEAADAACQQVLRLCDGTARPAAQRRFDCAVIWRESVGPGPHAALGPAPRSATAPPLAVPQRRGSTTQY